MKKGLVIVLLVVVCSAFTTLSYYPIDGYSHTGIKRLKRLELIKSGEIVEASKLPAGAYKSYMDIKLNLLPKQNDSVECYIKVNEDFQKEINGLFRGLDKSYSLAVLDISDINHVRFAQRNEKAGYQPGSVGKIAVLIGLFNQLAKIYPDDFEKRLELLRNKSVKSGLWGLTDEHTVPIYNIETRKLVKRHSSWVIPKSLKGKFTTSLLKSVNSFFGVFLK